MPKLRTIQEIADEITQCIGFFPPFFEPALDSAAVLENLWQQSWSAYLTSDLPPLFREKLAVLLAQHVAVPYCMLCHASTLSPLGLKGPEIFALLQRPLPHLQQAPSGLHFLKKLPDDAWPTSPSDVEDILLDAALVMFFEQDEGQTSRKLKAILPSGYFNLLVLFLSYNRMGFQWVKSHPEISYERDPRFIGYFHRIVAEDPRLDGYFHDLLQQWREHGRIANPSLLASDFERRKIIGERDAALKLLQQEKDWLAQIVDRAPFAINMAQGSERRLVIANREFCRIVGRTNTDVVGKSIDEVFPDLRQMPDWEEYNQIWKDGQTIDISEKSFAPMAEGRFFKVIRQAKRGEDGAIEAVLSFTLEVTDQVHAKKAAEYHKLWLESILNRMPAGLILVEQNSAALLLHNKLAADMLGESLTGESSEAYPFTFLDKDGRRLTFNEYPSTRAARGEIVRDEIVEVKSKQGDFYICISADPLPSVFGYPAAVVVAFHDITALKRTEIAVQKSQREAEISESRLALAVEASQIGFWEYDLRTRWTHWSETFRQQFDFPPGQYEGFIDSAIEKIHLEDRGHVEEVLKACLAESKPFHLIYRVVSRTGNITWIEGRGRYQFDEYGTMFRMHGTCLDVTETKKVQEELQRAKDNAERANEAESAFLANMSHEIRTPLTAIMGYTDLLKDANLSDDERNGFIDIINRNGKALTKLIEDILDLTKVEAGKLVTENENFSLRDLVADVLLIFKDAASNKGISLLTEIKEDLPDRLFADAVRLRQILVNIVGNAVKFTSEGYVKLTARIEQGETRDLLKIEVEDTGIGLTGEEMNRLFQPFVQADNSTSRRFGGTGLGLALSRRLAAVLGGNISILRSQPMRGSCFLIEIEVDIAPAADIVIPVKDTIQIDREVLQGVKILLVEDAPDNSLLISNMLGYYGAEVETAGNGLTGVEMAMAGMFDVVLMDIQMPLMDGYEAFQRLKSNHYKAPIIALTAHAMIEEKKRTHQLGFVAHITKPIDPIELISCVRKFSYIHRNLQSINP